MERRTFLVLGAAAVGLAGCTRGPVEPNPPSAPAPSTVPADPDSRLRDEVAASEVALIAAYRSAIGANPELAADLAPFLAHHEQHLARVAPGDEAGAGPAASPSGSDSVATTPTPGASPSTSVSGAPSESTADSRLPSGSPAPTTPAATSAEETSDVSAEDALAGLAAAESEAQAQRASACDGAQDPALARDLCLIAASEAQHAIALEGLAGQEPSS